MSWRLNSSQDYLKTLAQVQESLSVTDVFMPAEDDKFGSNGSNWGMLDVGKGGVANLEEALTRETGSHMKYRKHCMSFDHNVSMYSGRVVIESCLHVQSEFSEGSTQLFCKIFFAEQFDALRKNCGCDETYVQSLSRCIKWDSSGGKSGSTFLKTRGRLLTFLYKVYDESSVD
jgi:hypothetical protein